MDRVCQKVVQCQHGSHIIPGRILQPLMTGSNETDRRDREKLYKQEMNR